MTMNNTVKKKVCSKCGEEKPLTEFYKSGNTKNDIASNCKKCRKEYFKIYYSRPEVKERARKYRRLPMVRAKAIMAYHNFYKKDPIFMKKQLERQKAYEAKPESKIKRKRQRFLRLERNKENYKKNFLTIKPSRRFLNNKGYYALAFGRFFTPEHTHLMRKHLNWCFGFSDGEVHHKNGIRTDNRIENLEFIPRVSHKSHRFMDEYHRAIKTIAEQDKEINRLKEILKQKGISNEE